jgi:hypothetical protein
LRLRRWAGQTISTTPDAVAWSRNATPWAKKYLIGFMNCLFRGAAQFLHRNRDAANLRLAWYVRPIVSAARIVMDHIEVSGSRCSIHPAFWRAKRVRCAVDFGSPARRASGGRTGTLWPCSDPANARRHSCVVKLLWAQMLWALRARSYLLPPS